MLKKVLVEVENILNRLIINLMAFEEAASEENVIGNRTKEDIFNSVAKA